MACAHTRLAPRPHPLTPRSAHRALSLGGRSGKVPLVTLSGRPCVGKTRFATGLVAYLQATYPNKPVVLVNEEGSGVSKVEGYKGRKIRCS